MSTQLSLPCRPLILGIAGCSGSGKTTLARELTTLLSANLLPLDLYYRDLSYLPPGERATQNFDHPDSLEFDLLVQHIEALSACRSIDRPIYDFATHTRVPDRTDPLTPANVLVVEGILALHDPRLRHLYDLSIYVNAPHDLCLIRRIDRDVRERDRTEVSVRRQFEDFTRPMADQYVLPSARYASMTVEGNVALDWSVEQILRRLRSMRLLP